MTAALLVLLAVLLLPGRAVPLPARTAQQTRARHRERTPDPAALAETFAAGLRSGLSPADATAWCAGDPSAVVDPDAVPAWWADRVPAVARALAVAQESGAPAADAVAAAAEAVREGTQVERDIGAGLAGVRATAWLLTALPAAGAVGVLATSGGQLGAAAWGAMALGAAATGAGWWLLRRLVDRARRQALA